MLLNKWSLLGQDIYSTSLSPFNCKQKLQTFTVVTLRSAPLLWGNPFTWTFYGADSVHLWELVSKATLFIDLEGDTHNKTLSIISQLMVLVNEIMLLFMTQWFTQDADRKLCMKGELPFWHYWTHLSQTACWLNVSILAVLSPSEPGISQLIYFLTQVRETVWSAFLGFQPSDTKSTKTTSTFSLASSKNPWCVWCWTFIINGLSNENQKKALCLLLALLFSTWMCFYWWLSKSERRGKWHHNAVKGESHSALCVGFLTCSGLHTGCLLFIYRCCFIFFICSLQQVV